MKKIVLVILALLCLCGCTAKDGKSEVGHLYINTQYKGQEYLFSLSDKAVGGYAVEHGGGYVGIIESDTIGESGRVAVMDADGKITKILSADNGRYCIITDIASFGGRVYVAAYSLPKGLNTEQSRCNYEVAALEKYCNNEFQMLDFAVKSYKAELYVIKDGALEKIASEDGCRSSELCIYSEGLEWSVGKIVGLRLPKAVVSSFKFSGKCKVTAHTYSQSGQVISSAVSDTPIDIFI